MKKYSLRSAKSIFSVNKKGKIIELANSESGHNYAGGELPFRLIIQEGGEIEKELSLEKTVCSVNLKDNAMSVVYNVSAGIILTMNVRQNNEELEFSLDIRNNSKSIILKEFQFGIQNCKYRSGQFLYRSAAGGEIIKDIDSKIASGYTFYSGNDHKAIEEMILYPSHASMNYFCLSGDGETLYMGSHDTTLQTTIHLLRKRKNKIDILFAKYPCLLPGQSLHAEPFVIAPLSGTWQKGADIYRNWAVSSWFKKEPVSKNAEGLRGWQRIIMRQQNGEVYYKYDDLMKMSEDGKKAGLDTVLMFGWHTHGHDNGYPDYAYDESQGGFRNLKENIRKVRKTGGKVIVYFNSKLMDADSDFYRETGHRIAVKTVTGSEERNIFTFPGDGTFIKTYGCRCLVNACLGCGEWVEILKKFVDISVELEADGVFFDQLGTVGSRGCCDKSHGHPVPYIESNLDKVKVLKELRDYLKSRNPEMSIGVEILTDTCGPYADYIHSVAWGRNIEMKGDDVKMNASGYFPEMFRYTFPEVIVSDREIRNENDFRRRANLTFIRGQITDAEIYRCKKTIAETPNYAAYLKEINRLRDKYYGLFFTGKYMADEGFQNKNREIEARLFINKNQAAIALSQSHLENAATDVSLQGYKYLEADGTGKYKAELAKDGTVKVSLAKNALAVLIFRSC